MIQINHQETINYEELVKILPRDLPVIVDFDGTLAKFDSLKMLRSQAYGKLENLRILEFEKGKQFEKIFLWEQIGLKIDEIPFDQALLKSLRELKSKNYSIHLVSGSAEGLVRTVATHLGIFDSYKGSVFSKNLTGSKKAEFLTSTFGNFAYLGDSPADLFVWENATVSVYLDRGTYKELSIQPKVWRLRASSLISNTS